MPREKKVENSEIKEEKIEDQKQVVEEMKEEANTPDTSRSEEKTESTKKKTTEKSHTEVETNGPETKYGTITNAPYVNLRKEASLGSDVLEVLTENDKVKIFGKEKDFYRVKALSRRIGFVQDNYIKEE